MTRVLVTGANRTLGRAVAERLIQDPSYHPILSGRDPARVHAVFPGLDSASIEGLDFSKALPTPVLKGLVCRLKPLAAVVHCASYYGPGSLLIAPETDLESCLTFLGNTLRLVRSAAEAFGEEGGRIILMGSVAADPRTLTGRHGLYGFFKGSLREMCRHVAKEIARRQGTITYVNLGSFQAEGEAGPGDRSRLPLGEVTSLVCNLVALPPRMRVDEVDCFPLDPFREAHLADP
ncbi:SDR family oxidoreductase [Mesoterricola silvestris]|uniref:Short-chain dehydrogenase n=1 Tax=Mesoterricola silvestris TaxID=2927979 RepID=A0AA48GZZ3_9BACT|nr:SDR family oxidoreductase [Mesoterricola silvestris]BDU74956.1 hypothetical protein METEAL_41300 [Mesoterricola silvestris]